MFRLKVLITSVLLFMLNNNYHCKAQTQTQKENAIIIFPTKEYRAVPIKKIISDLNLFNKVTNLGDLDLNNQTYDKLRQLFDGLSNEELYILEDELRNNIDTEMLKLLVDFKKIIAIKVIEHTSEVELSFYLIQAIPGELNNTNLKAPIIKDITDSYTIIKKEDAEDAVLSKIELAIKRLFPKVNQAPLLEFKINQFPNNTIPDTLLHVQSDTLTIDASISTDRHTEHEDLKFAWKQLDQYGEVALTKKQLIQFKENASKQQLLLPDTGLFFIQLTLSDGISKQKKLFKIHSINRPKIRLSDHQFNHKKSVSFFQFIKYYKKLRRVDKQINVQYQNINGIKWQPNIQTKKHLHIYPEKVQHRIKEIIPSNFQLSLSGRVLPQQVYQYHISGTSNLGIVSDTAIYTVKQPKHEFYKLSIGLEWFWGPGILCASQTRNPELNQILFTVPITLNGAIYLGHWNAGDTALSLESGFLVFWDERATNNIASMLAKMSIKAEAYQHYLAFHVIGGPVQNPVMGNWQNRRHWGMTFGRSLRNRLIEVDYLNMYYQFSEQCLTLSGGMRLNVVEVFSKRRQKRYY